jgi:hypothetical protein
MRDADVIREALDASQSDGLHIADNPIGKIGCASESLTDLSVSLTGIKTRWRMSGNESVLYFGPDRKPRLRQHYAGWLISPALLRAPC